MAIPFLAIGPGDATVAFLSVGPSITSGSDDIIVDAPLAAERLLVGETVDIHLSVTPFVSGPFDVLLSIDGGNTFPITLLSAETEINLSWTITAAHISATAVLRVRDSADALMFGDSGEFVIATTSPGSGDNTEVLAAIAALQSDLADVQASVDAINVSTGQGSSLAAAIWTAGSISGFPSELAIGDSYVEELSRHIKVYYRDAQAAPITAIGTKTFIDSDFRALLSLRQDNLASEVKGSCAWVPAVGQTEGFVKVQLPKDQTRRAGEGVARMQLVFRWGDSFEVEVATQAVTWRQKVIGA